MQDRICDVEYTIPETVPEQARDLISKLLVRDPTKRLGACDVKDLKEHKFFEGLDFETFLDTAAPLKKSITMLPQSKKQLLNYLPNRKPVQAPKVSATTSQLEEKKEHHRDKSKDERKQRPREGLQLTLIRTCASDNAAPIRKISGDDTHNELSSTSSDLLWEHIKKGTAVVSGMAHSIWTTRLADVPGN